MTKRRRSARAAPRRRTGPAQSARDQAADTMRAFIRTLEKLGERRGPSPVRAGQGEGAR